MTADASPNSAGSPGDAGPRPRPGRWDSVDGQVELYQPADWFDVLADAPPGPEADVAAEGRFAEMLAAGFPTIDKATLDAGVDALLAWRAMMLDAGMVSHGVINCPSDPDADPNEAARHVMDTGDAAGWANWHVLTAVIDLPAVPAELNLGEVLARMLGQELDPEASYVESFSTEMGCGTGLIIQPWFPSAAEAAAAGAPQVAETLTELGLSAPDSEPVRYGLATALSTAPGGGPALVVSGMCLDPDQVLDLAALVAMIAGNSRVHLSPSAGEGS